MGSRRSRQYLRVGSTCAAVSFGNTDSSVTMRFGIGLPATTSLTAAMSCGPSKRTAFHGDVELAGDHRLERALHAVDGDDDDVGAGLEAGFLDGLDGADRHVVVVREQHVDLLAFGLEERLHDFLALGAREVAGLRADDLVARIGGDDFGEALLAIVGGRRAHGALQLDDVDVALSTSFVFSSSQRPALRPSSTKSEPISDRYSESSRDLDGAIGEDHRDVRGLGFAQHRFPAGFDHRRERDDVDALRDERAQRLDLVFLLLLRVGESQRDAGLGAALWIGLGVGGAPFAFGADLAEARARWAWRHRRRWLSDRRPSRPRAASAANPSASLL